MSFPGKRGPSGPEDSLSPEDSLDLEKAPLAGYKSVKLECRRKSLHLVAFGQLSTCRASV